MGSDTEYDDEPNVFHQEAGPRSAQRFEVNIGERSLAMVARSSFIAGISLAFCLFCGGIAWWAITEHRITQGRLQSMMIQQDALVKRVDKLEK